MREMILTLGDSLQALHIHDNDRHHDSHQIPFSMNIDFDDMLSSLKEIGYKGYLTLEADAYLRSCASNDVEKGVKDLAAAARRLADKYDAL